MENEETDPLLEHEEKDDDDDDDSAQPILSNLEDRQHPVKKFH